MKQIITAQLKLSTDASQFAALRQTPLAYRDALNDVSQYSFTHGKMSNQRALQRDCYDDIRAASALPSQMAFHSGKKVVAKANLYVCTFEREVAGKNTMWYQGEEEALLKPRRCPMPIPIICLDDQLRQFAERFRQELSKPQHQYLVIVLLGLMLCEGRRTLRGLLRQVADGPSLAGLSRFLAQAPWQAAAMVEHWLKHFRETMQPLVEADLQRQHQAQPKRPGRPKPPVGIGYLIGDDSTLPEANA